MYKIHVFTTLRALKKDKLYTGINILGLAIGLSAGLMILLYVKYELSYDNWIPDSESIYRLHTTYERVARFPMRTVRSSGPMAENLPLSFPEINSVVRLSKGTLTAIHKGEAYNQSILMVDPSFFDVFDLPLVAGTPETALNELSSIVISETTRERYFGDDPALGKVLTLCCVKDEPQDFKISAILKDLPENSHLDLQALILINKPAFQDQPNMFEDWTSVNNFTYIKFRPNTNITNIESRLPAFIDDKIPYTGPGKRSDNMHLSLMNLQDLHLLAGFQASDIGDIKPPGSMTSVIAFSATAILILVIASINFINLATARSSYRALEVSLRKTVGAEKRQLIFQFLEESLSVTLIAMLCALIIAIFTMPLFSNFLRVEINPAFFSDPTLILSIIFAVLMVGIISGLYPAIHLSSFKPAEILTNNINKSNSALAMGGFRAVLVIIQFTVSISLLIITGVIYFQTEYAKSVELGFDRENRLVVRGSGGTRDRSTRDTFKDRGLSLPEVRSAVLSSDAPTDNSENNTNFYLIGEDSEQAYGLTMFATDYGFMEAYGIGLIAGRDLSNQYSNDTHMGPAAGGAMQTISALVNESAMHYLGFSNPNEVLGQILRSFNYIDGRTEYRIVGVIPDIQFRSIKYDIRPAIYFRSDAWLDNLSISFISNNVQEFVNKIELLWRETYPQIPFDYTFVEDLISNQYTEEDRQSIVLLIFTCLTVFVAFLGLFGLASFVSVQRTQEIGIRKALGAEVPDIVKLMLWQFSKPVLLATLIAWPLAWYLSQNWLQDFKVRISSFNPLIYLGATFAALVIAWITVAGHTYKSARTKPSIALRDE